MKKSALTSLMLLVAFKSVSACGYIAGTNKSFSETLKDIEFYTTVYLFSIFSLFLANFGLIILREKKDTLFRLLIIGTSLVMIPLTFFGMAMEECGLLFAILKWELIFILILFAIQLYLWVTKSELDLRRKRELDLPSIKPQ